MSLFFLLLISMLDANSFRQREAATRVLIHLAPALLPELELLETDPRPEVASRARLIVNTELLRRLRAGTITPRGRCRLPKLTVAMLGNPDDFNLQYEFAALLPWLRDQAQAAGWQGDLDRGATWQMMLIFSRQGYSARELRHWLEEPQSKSREIAQKPFAISLESEGFSREVIRGGRYARPPRSRPRLH